MTAAKDETQQEPIIEGQQTLDGKGVKRDWTIAQRAWWDAIIAMHERPSAIRVALEMRVMGGSEILLAPQRGNRFGTCSIEVLTTFDTATPVWHDFCQQLSDKWTSYIDRSTGKRLRARPHWCKEWEFLKLPDEFGRKISAIEWMETIAFKDEIPKFREQLKKVGEGAGFNSRDLRARFSNHLLERIFWGIDDGAVLRNAQPEDNPKGLVSRLKRWVKRVFE
jgi:hypothetical protein